MRRIYRVSWKYANGIGYSEDFDDREDAYRCFRNVDNNPNTAMVDMRVESVEEFAELDEQDIIDQFIDDNIRIRNGVRTYDMNDPDDFQACLEDEYDRIMRESE